VDEATNGRGRGAPDVEVAQLHVWVRRELWQRVREHCRRESVHLRTFVADALREHLAARSRGAVPLRVGDEPHAPRRES